MTSSIDTTTKAPAVRDLTSANQRPNVRAKDSDGDSDGSKSNVTSQPKVSSTTSTLGSVINTTA